MRVIGPGRQQSPEESLEPAVGFGVDFLEARPSVSARRDRESGRETLSARMRRELTIR